MADITGLLLMDFSKPDFYLRAAHMEKGVCTCSYDFAQLRISYDEHILDVSRGAPCLLARSHVNAQVSSLSFSCACEPMRVSKLTSFASPGPCSGLTLWPGTGGLNSGGGGWMKGRSGVGPVSVAEITVNVAGSH